MTATQLAPRFFLAAAVILGACRGVQWAVGRVGQPPVVGEMVAGVLLGPSLLGAVWPWGESHIFPTALIPIIYVAGQVGLVALMYSSGRELRNHLQARLAGTAASISALGISLPFALGFGLTMLAHGHVPVFVTGVSVPVTAAFVAVALAITAFPMLARIISERGLAGSRFGALALASGALDDVVAWMLLAGVLSLAAGRSGPIIKAAGGALIFGLAMVLVVRPALERLVRRPGLSSETVVLIILGLLFASAWWTDEIGLYAVFGAFTLGLVTPRHDAVHAVEPVTGTLSRVFVPMFFVYSGLHTKFGVFHDVRIVLFAVAAVLVAVIGKLGAGWLGARLRGEDSGTALRVGALLNARGLMQLIALNVGLQAGIVTEQLFTSLVLVALITTLMTTPLLSLMDRRERRARRPEAERHADPAYAA